MSDIHGLIENMWRDYATMNPQADAIHKLLASRDETIDNDHIALRTYNHPRTGIEVLAKPFLDAGYKPAGEYEFIEKKLTAKHYEHPDKVLPRVFISQLLVEQFDAHVGEAVDQLVAQVPDEVLQRPDLPVAGRPWVVSYKQYEGLRGYSEYAAWMAAFGFRVNHFTVDVGALKCFPTLKNFNDYLEENGFKLNNTGGKIKGSPDVYLEQSSTLADPVRVEFSDGREAIPGCYYEFAKRYPLPDGTIFSGFVTKSADKIFQSTDRQDKPH